MLEIDRNNLQTDTIMKLNISEGTMDVCLRAGKMREFQL